MYVITYVYLYIYTYIYKYIHIYICISIYMHITDLELCMYTYIFMCNRVMNNIHATKARTRKYIKYLCIRALSQSTRVRAKNSIQI
jgi:hypothetical protein